MAVLESCFVDLNTASDAQLAEVIAGSAGAAAPSGSTVTADQTAAEQTLLTRLAPRVRLYGLRHLRDEQAAADLVQQVLLIVLESLREGRVNDPEKLVSFVLGTCRMVVMDQRRGTQRRQKLLEKYPNEFPTVEPAREAPVDMDVLERCLQALAERERSVISMSYFEEQGSAVVGASLGLSEANVRVIRHRALGHLRTCMTGGVQ